MTRALDRIIPLLQGVRARGENQWAALCPAHPDRNPSLSIRQASDRVLITCWTGCHVRDVVGALGLELRDLYDRTNTTKPDIQAVRYQRAIDGLRQWRDREISRCARALRERDAYLLAIRTAFKGSHMSEEKAWRFLGVALDGYGELQHRFEVLRTGTDAEVLEVQRGNY